MRRFMTLVVWLIGIYVSVDIMLFTASGASEYGGVNNDSNSNNNNNSDNHSRSLSYIYETL